MANIYKYVNINNNPIAAKQPATTFYPYATKVSLTGNELITNSSFSPVVNTSGIENYGFRTEIYNQIHLFKQSYDFGFVSKNTTDILEVWNAYYDVTQNITAINYNLLDNIRLTDLDFNDVITPFTLKPLETRSYYINVDKDGNSEVSGNIEFIANGISIKTNIKLSRAFLFDFDVNYRDNVIESYQFKTNINKSVNYSEQREAYRSRARATFQYNYTLNKKERRLLDKFVYSGINRTVALPVITQKAPLISVNGLTLGVNISNTAIQVGINLLIEDSNNSEIVTVTQIINNNSILIRENLFNTYSNATVTPLFNCKLNPDFNITRNHHDLLECTLVFEKIIDSIDPLVTNNASNYNTLNSIKILDVEPNRQSNMSWDYFQNIVTLDNGYSRTESFQYSDTSEISFDHNILLDGKDEISKLKNLHKFQKGMLEDIYSYSNNNDFLVIENILQSDTILRVENNNLSDYYSSSKAIKYLVIESNNIKKECQILDIYQIDEDKEAIVLSESFGYNLNWEDINNSQFIFRGRLASDSIDIVYNHDELATVNLKFIKTSDVK